MAWTTFGNLTNPTLGELDVNFLTLAAQSATPGTLSGTNSITFTLLTGAPPVAAYQNYAAFGGVATATNTGPASFAVSGLAALTVYNDTSSGPVALSGGEIESGNFVGFIYDLALNSGAGGFHLMSLVNQAAAVSSITAGATGLVSVVDSAGAYTIDLASIANNTLISNITGGAHVPAANTLSAVLDAVLSSTQGAVIYRSASAWTALAPGTAGQFLETGGAAANPSWAAPAGAGSIATALTATGSNQGTALALTANYNQLTTVNSSTGVIIWTNLGQFQEIANAGSNTLNIYPPTGAQINAAGANTAITLAAGSVIRVTMYTSTQGYSH